MRRVRNLGLAVALLAAALAGGPAAADMIYVQKGLSVEEAVSTIAVSPDGESAAFGLSDGALRILDSTTGQQTGFAGWPEQALLGAVFSPDGKRIAVSTQQGQIGIFDIAASARTVTITPPAPAGPLAFSPGGDRIAAVLSDGSIGVFSSADGSPATTIRPDGDTVFVDLSFSPNGEKLAAVTLGRAVDLWTLDGAPPLLERRIQLQKRVNSAAFSPDGTHLVIGSSDHLAHVIGLADGRETLTLTGHEDEVRSAAYNPDGKTIITGSDDRTARIWSAADGKLIAVLGGHLADVRGVAFSTRGDRIVTLASDARARFWTRFESGPLPETIIGVWHQSLDTTEDIPDEINRTLCASTPVAITRGGAVTLYESPDGGSFQALQTLSCHADLTCLAFAGASGQQTEPQAEGRLKMEGGKVALCVGPDCLALDRCKPMAWTEEERANGLAKAWDDLAAQAKSPN